MVAYAWGREHRWSPGDPPLIVVPGAGDRPATLSDDERAAYARLGAAGWWGWANRGRFDAPAPWENGR